MTLRNGCRTGGGANARIREDSSATIAVSRSYSPSAPTIFESHVRTKGGVSGTYRGAGR